TRRSVSLIRPTEVPKERRVTSRTGDIDCDDALFNHLRTLRKKIADEREVPAYIIFGDRTLRHLVREYPTSVDGMDKIFGIGEMKRAEFGALFAAEISNYLESNTRQRFD
ncbi:MAG: DNA helicase RecQ, partial [Dehalococcoidia bacterium]